MTFALNLPSTLAPRLREPALPVSEFPLLLDRCNIHSANTVSLLSARPGANNGGCNGACPQGAYVLVKETSENKKTEKLLCELCTCFKGHQTGLRQRVTEVGRLTSGGPLVWSLLLLALHRALLLVLSRGLTGPSPVRTPALSPP